MLEPIAARNKMSWRKCPLEDDEDIVPPPPVPDVQTLRQRSRRSWCKLDIEENVRPQQKQERSTKGNSCACSGQQGVQRARWCKLDLCDAEDEPVPGSRSRSRSHGLRSHGLRSQGRRSQGRNWRQLDLQEIEGDACPVRKKNWRQLDFLDEEPLPQPPAVRIKNASLSATTLSFLSNMPTKQGLNAYDKNGMDPERIRRVLKKGCKCKKKCMRQFTFSDIHDLCRVYHQMLESDRQYMLHTMYTGVSSPEVPGPGATCRHQWQILGHDVCVPAFCDLLGISCKKLYKDIRLAVDGRRSVDGAGIHPRCTPQLDMCHHFFRQLYISAAEVCPQHHPTLTVMRVPRRMHPMNSTDGLLKDVW